VKGAVPSSCAFRCQELPKLVTLRRLIALTLAVLLLSAAPAVAQTAKVPATAAPASNVSDPAFPALTGRVVDQANIIPADVEAQLVARLAALEAKSSDQLVVATVTSLQGYEIEEYGYRLGRTWQIGQGERLNNGVILLVAPNERKVRIEVGYGLEGVLTDMFTGQVVRNDIVPAFKAGDMVGGIVAGVAGIETLLTADPAELQARADRGLQEASASSDSVDPIAIIFIIIFIVIWIAMASGSTRNARFRRSRRQSGWNGAPITTHDWRNDNLAGDIAINVAGNILGSILSSGGGGGGGDSGGGGFSGGGGSFGGGGSSGSW
jgi:uncharacterized protein